MEERLSVFAKANEEFRKICEIPETSHESHIVKQKTTTNTIQKNRK